MSRGYRALPGPPAVHPDAAFRAGVGLAAVIVALGSIACSGAPPVPAGPQAPVDSVATGFPEGLEYMPPAAGTYDLPPIMPATDGLVLDTGNVTHRLFEYMGDRYVLLSFIYTHCTDGEGCPLATGALAAVREMLADQPDLSPHIRLISLSFDPARDTPEVILRYAEHGGLLEPAADGKAPAAGGDRPWIFLTTSSRTSLQEILDGYGQTIVPEIDAAGKPTGGFTHVLKVFLIDRQRRIRNIYSTSFLHPATALNDLRTLWMEEQDIGPG